MKKIRLFNFAALLFAAAFMITSCQKDLTGELNPTEVSLRFGDCTVDPVSSEGNAVCTEGYEATSEKFDIDGPELYSGNYGPISYQISADGKYLTWSGDVCGVQVIVKGGPSANTYTYADCKGASGLQSPLMVNGNVPQISNLTFCWNVCPVELPPGCDYETAWGGSTKGAGKAWWYAFDTDGDKTQPIYAGQQMTDGTVTYDGTNLIINLGSSMTLQAGDETVKVQGYDTLPTSRPAAGKFTTYKGTSLTVDADDSRYYAIHLDVIFCE